jgi:arsenate reductase-like glutaredoxin family protein
MPNIAVDEHTHKEAKKLCKTHDISLGELVQHSVIYFKKTGINPSDADNESPIKAIKELDKHVGQVVGFIKTHEKEKLNPLLEYLLVLRAQLDDTIKKLPKAERFDAVVEAVNKHAGLLIESHKKQVTVLQKTQQEINQESLKELKNITANLTNLIKGFNTLHADQEAIKTVIETKLSKKLF